MTHQDIESLLPDRVLGYLSPEMEERIDQHLDWCWICRISFSETVAIWIVSELREERPP